MGPFCVALNLQDQDAQRILMLYQLKTYCILDWYRILSHSIDLETGQKTTNIAKHRIKRCVAIPMSLSQKFWDLSQIPEFQDKGLVERQILTFLIDRKDTPLAWAPPNTEDWFVLDHKRWDILESTNYGHRVYVVLGAETVGQQMERIEETHTGLVLEHMLSLS